MNMTQKCEFDQELLTDEHYDNNNNKYVYSLKLQGLLILILIKANQGWLLGGSPGFI